MLNIEKKLKKNEKKVNDLLKQVKKMNKDASASIDETDNFIKDTEAKMRKLGIKF